jgi:hypothetical protein
MLSLRRKDIVCQRAVGLVTDYLEGALSRRERRRFEAHHRACPNCSAYLEQIRMTIEWSGAIEPEDLTPDARRDLTDLYRRCARTRDSGSVGSRYSPRPSGYRCRLLADYPKFPDTKRTTFRSLAKLLRHGSSSATIPKFWRFFRIRPTHVSRRVVDTGSRS